MMQSPYLVDRDVLYIYIEYDFVIGTSKADMNLSDVMVVKAKVPLNWLKPMLPLNKPLPMRLLTIMVWTHRLSVLILNTT